MLRTERSTLSTIRPRTKAVELLEPRRLLSSYGPDNYFGAQGVANVPFMLDNQYPTNAVATSPDGRIYVASDSEGFQPANIALARLTFNGKLDPSFGKGGTIQTLINNSASYVNTIRIQNDGKVIIGGGFSFNFALLRYNSDGSPDLAFGAGGIVTVPRMEGNFDYENSAFLQADGKIVAVGFGDNGNHYLAEMVRYNADGTRDGNFGTAGKVVTDFGTAMSTEFAGGLALPNGQILVSGAVANRPLLARYNADGSLDTTFGNNGLAITTGLYGNNYYGASGLALAPDGGFYALLNPLSGQLSALSKWTADGNIDATWGISGVYPLQGWYGGSIAVQPDQSIVVEMPVMPSGFNVSTISPTGQKTLFSTSQSAGYYAGTDFGSVNLLALQPDGRTVVGGTFYPFPQSPPTGGALVFRYRTMADLPEGVRLEGSIVTVLGESSPNVVNITSDPTNYTVNLNGTVQTYPVSAVSHIDVRLYGGGNSVTTGPGVPLGIVDMGGGANNTAVIGGGTLYLINAGTGNDTITMPAPADGGDGNSIVEGAVSDTLLLTGTPGPDVFKVGPTTITSPGRELTYALIGHVRIDTGSGDDSVELDAGGPAVTVNGGSGNDVFTTTGGGTAASPDVISAGTGANQLIATTARSSTLQFVPDPAGSDAVRLISGNTMGQAFSLTDAGVTTNDGFALSLVGTPAIKGLEIDGGPGVDTFTMVRSGIGIPTTIMGGAGNDQYLATGVALASSSNVVFHAASGHGALATLSDVSGPGDTSHTYTIGMGVIQRDASSGFQYSGLNQLRFQTGNGGSVVNILDAAGMSLLAITGGQGSNIMQVTSNPGGLGMTANSQVILNGVSGGPNIFRVVPDPSAFYSVSGGSGLRDRLEVDFASGPGAILTTTGTGRGNYTFSSRGSITFAGIGSLNDIPVPVGAGFQASAPQSLVFPFSSDVGGSLTTSKLQLTNTSTNSSIPAADMFLAYNAQTFTATFTFPGFAGGMLPGGNYIAKIPAGSIQDTAGRPLAADDVLNFLAPPHLVGTRVNDGSEQRSMVGSFTLIFDSAVTLGLGALTLVRLNTGGSGLNDNSNPTDVSAGISLTSLNNGKAWAVNLITSAASLPDGIYTLTIHANSVTDTANNPLTGGDQSFTFHRLFGDINGDKTVNSADYFQLKAAFGSIAGQANFNGDFDFDGNGKINSSDYFKFKANFGRKFTY